ncbi:SusC/RagA family TonB-linked outer membrane protein [Maribellus comscasis]|uniref:SusC/RagA family TonB-linked outer membrane protein n=1 Tax=Maribellus comscasis TaxID=2681766 RepID=A0A6I6JYG2_9BACT|nr:TonB-dependent receptor [Maribellus comscasis]QGY45212.1 SusC/RagA family TonB-linked outer membrane protein [Maribellus comscasis]
MKKISHFAHWVKNAFLLQKILLMMRITIFLLLVFTLQTLGIDSYSQSTRLTLSITNSSLKDVLGTIEDNSEFYFLYSSKMIDVNQTVDANFKEQNIFEILAQLLKDKNIDYEVKDRQILLSPSGKNAELSGNYYQQDNTISGTVSDTKGVPLPGVTVVVQGTTNGTVTDANGYYTIKAKTGDILGFSFIGMKSIEIPVNNQSEINAILEADVIGIDEVVAIGYGTQKKEDLTGSIASGDMDAVLAQPNLSVLEGLQGMVPGLNIGQSNQAGENPSLSIRGQSTLSGEQDPLIVLDGVIFRGNLIDVNPSDIKSISVLKDASARAIYGSQASNGVIQIVTTTGKGEASIKYSGRFSIQSPHNQLRAETNGEKFMQKIAYSDIQQSRTAESGYLEANPDWTETTNFKTSHEIRQYELGRTYDWYDGVTTDNPYTTSHNISVSNATEKNNYFSSIGYTKQDGHMLDEHYERINGRINLSSKLTNWLELDIQSFLTLSDYGPQTYSPADRYLEPFATPTEEDGTLVQRPAGNAINPQIEAKADVEDKRFNLGANITGNVYLPIEGLKYQMRFGNNYLTTRKNFFDESGNSFTGLAYKRYDIEYTMSLDNIVSYNQTFNDIHQIDVTLLYGIEKREQEYTRAEGAGFANTVLGFDRLQAADASLQTIESGGWKESSLYNMGRISYKLMNKYLVNATIRRDGFSGFSEANKFGYFPSLALGWVISEEPFLNKSSDWLNWLKLRVSYGATGNRTIGRYDTLAQVSGESGYITSDGSSIYTQWISALESPNLRWEKTTGINLGVDFRLFDSRLNGSLDYYNNNTTDLLYNVNIPGVSRFQVFPDNLGKIHNHGVELQITSVNIRKKDFSWTTDFNFSRNRDIIKELLGFDLDGDGKEDDLISEGLFINESLGTIYDYKINGIWQLDDDIPDGYEFGSYRVVDLNNDSKYDADDKTILGNEQPSYRFSINNIVNYKNWTLRLFINSVQGGNGWYLGEDTMYGFLIFNQENHFNITFPTDIDYWTPENPNAKYQRPGINGSSGIAGTRYTSRSFIRLKDLSISYTLAPRRIEFVKSMRFILSGRNLLTLTKWPGWDPETGEGLTRNGRPVMESYSLGIDVTF